MEVQLWICALFLADFVLEWFLATDKKRYIATHFIFLLVAIPYQNIIAYMGWTFSPEVTYMLRFIPLVRGGYAMGIHLIIKHFLTADFYSRRQCSVQSTATDRTDYYSRLYSSL